MRYEGVVDIFQTVKMLRTQRPAMVQTEVRKISMNFITSQEPNNPFYQPEPVRAQRLSISEQNTGKYCWESIQLFNIFEPHFYPSICGSDSFKALQLFWKLCEIIY